MVTKYEKIRQLYIERLAGMFNEEDESRFQEMLNSDAEAKAIVEELKRESNAIHIESFVNETDEETELLKLKSRLNKNKRIANLKPWLIAASLISFITLGILWYPSKDLEQANGYENLTNATGDKGVSLQLSNGESVDLSKNDVNDTIAVGKLRLITKGNSFNGTEGEASSTMNVLSVPAKQDYKIVLADGTQVWLNSESKLTFPFKFAGNTREVVVEGEAYFDVAKDVNLPFIVRTKQTSIRVIGTRFNVNTYNPKQIQTSLVEGKVNLTANNSHSISLKPGFEAKFNPDKGFVVQEFNQENVLSWMNGIYYLNNTPLGSLTGLISRWFEVDVVFDNPQLKDYQITGLLEKEHLSDFLKDLETSANIEYYYSGNRLHIK